MKNLLLKIIIFSIVCASVLLFIQAQQRAMRAPGMEQTLLLKDYRPESIFKTPQTEVLKARYPAIDTHMHAPRDRGQGNFDMEAECAAILKNMDACNVEKTILFCGTGETFDEVAAAFGKYPDRFELWCGLDLSGRIPEDTIAELERCVKMGAKGVGEISDKGSGLRGATPPMHIDDPRMDPILERMADLDLPINHHSGDPKWMYEPMNEHNDLLFEALYFRLDDKEGILDQEGLRACTERALQKHPRTKFVLCHFMNRSYDLNQLGEIFDKYPNVWADVSQREAYVAAIPRFAKQFIEKYADRIVWGTDQGYSLSMYRNTFHIWETLDEHFYAWDVSNTPYALSGVGLSDATLKKFYRDNALEFLKKD